MKIKIASDLHLEHSDVIIKNDEGCDVLVLAGDICVADDFDSAVTIDELIDESVLVLKGRQISAQRYIRFFKQVSEDFKHVVYVAGNHEFYHGKWVKSLAVLRAMCSRFHNVHFLERDTVELEGVAFIGGSLWTDCNQGDPLTLHALTGLMTDYDVIRNDDLGYTKLKPTHTMARHHQTLQYIKHVVGEKRESRCVVVSHHAPCSKSIDTNYSGQYLMNGAYYSELSDFIMDSPQIKLWVHGHIHKAVDYMIGEAKIASCPRGYSSEMNEDQKGNDYVAKIVEI